MNFVNYSTAILPNLNYDKQQIILQSTIHSLYVNSITICNRSINDIRINLVKKIIGNGPNVKEGFVINNVEVQAPVTGKTDTKSTINLVSLFGLSLFLPVMVTNGVTYTTELICYSNGVNQNFDCIIDYTTFVETPII